MATTPTSKQKAATKKKPTGGAPTLEKGTQEYFSALKKSLPTTRAMEEKYRDKFTGLNLQDVGGFLNGTNGQTGMLGLGAQTTAAAGQQLNDARALDIAGMSGQTGAVRGMLGQLAPEAVNAINTSGGMVGQSMGALNQFQNAQVAGLQGFNNGIGQSVGISSQMSQDAYDRSQRLTPQESRDAMQFANEQSGARGRYNDNSNLAAGLLGRESILAGKRNEAANLTQQAYGQNMGASQNVFGQNMQNTQMAGQLRDEVANRNNTAYGQSMGLYGSMGGSLLSSTPSSYQGGQSYLGLGSQAIGAATPQMIDLGQGINMAAANQQNYYAELAARKSGSAAKTAGLYSGIGSIAGGLIGSFGGPLGTAAGAAIGGKLGGAAAG